MRLASFRHQRSLCIFPSFRFPLWNDANKVNKIIMQEVSSRIALRDEKQNVKNQSGFVLHHGFQNLEINGGLTPKTFAPFNRLVEAKRDPLLNVWSQYISWPVVIQCNSSYLNCGKQIDVSWKNKTHFAASWFGFCQDNISHDFALEDNRLLSRSKEVEEGTSSLQRIPEDWAPSTKRL